MSRVLVVEDDEAMAVALKDGFTYEGHEVAVARDGEEGLHLAREEKPDIMILDVMLPKMTGLEVCKLLRGEYVTKPFSFMELMARVEAVLRRTQPGRGSRAAHQFGDITIDLDRHESTKDGESIELTPREFRLLGYFLEHPGEVVSREQLLDAVWGYDTIPFTRTVDTHIAKLRKKIEDDPSDPQHLITVHRLGYKFVG